MRGRDRVRVRVRGRGRVDEQRAGAIRHGRPCRRHTQHRVDAAVGAVGVEAPCARRQQPRVGVRAHVGWPALLAAVERPLALKCGGGSVGDVGGRDDDLAEAAAVVRASAQADLAAAHLRLELGLGLGIGLG